MSATAERIDMSGRTTISAGRADYSAVGGNVMSL